MEKIKHLGNNISLLLALWAGGGRAVRFTKVNHPTRDQMNYINGGETHTP